MIPHFEKMLYDNAQIVDLLTAAWKETKSPLYEARIRETTDWIEREMIAVGGGFAAALDADSEGLILLTNDGEFCQRVAHPSHGLLKTYRVTVAKRLEPEALEQLTAGLRDKGDFLKARRARLLSANNTRSEAELLLAEGKNREVRRMFKALGLRVLRLQRVAGGPVKLGELSPGKWRPLSRAEVVSCLKPPGKSP